MIFFYFRAAAGCLSNTMSIECVTKIHVVVEVVVVVVR